MQSYTIARIQGRYNHAIEKHGKFRNDVFAMHALQEEVLELVSELAKNPLPKDRIEDEALDVIAVCLKIIDLVHSDDE